VKQALVVLAACGRIDFDAMPPSCAGLVTSCGATSCCDSPIVPGGTFSRSYDVSGDGSYADPSWVATVSTFRLDRYEVTVARYRAFVASARGTQLDPPVAGAGAHPHLPGSGWDPAWNATLPVDTSAQRAALLYAACVGYSTWTDEPGDNEDRPINCLGWLDAMAFCVWDGGYLPTEAEWNYAAAAGAEQRAFPWSTTADELAFDPSDASYFCIADDDPSCSASDILPVGSRPAGDGKWGQADLGGNMSEWVLDAVEDPYALPCDNCADLAGTVRGLRGGSFFRPPADMRTGGRGSSLPAQSSLNSGVSGPTRRTASGS
jgi:sulfatase modifying factor 1